MTSIRRCLPTALTGADRPEGTLFPPLVAKPLYPSDCRNCRNCRNFRYGIRESPEALPELLGESPEAWPELSTRWLGGGPPGTAFRRNDYPQPFPPLSPPPLSHDPAFSDFSPSRTCTPRTQMGEGTVVARPSAAASRPFSTDRSGAGGPRDRESPPSLPFPCTYLRCVTPGPGYRKGRLPLAAAPPPGPWSPPSVAEGLVDEDATLDATGSLRAF